MAVPPSTLTQIETALAAGQYSAARTSADRLVAAHPRDPAALRMMCRVLRVQGQTEQVIFYLQKLVSAAPGAEQAHLDLCLLLLTSHRVAEAESAARAGLEHHPQSGGLRYRLADAVLEQGRSEEAVSVLESIPAGSVPPFMLAKAAAHASNYTWPVDGAKVLNLHAAYARLVEQAAATRTWAPWAPGHSRPTRPLKVGFLSEDLYTHSVSFFLRPLLAGLDPAVIEPHCVHTGRRTDATTESLGELCRAKGGGFWRVDPSDPDRMLAEVRARQFDVLIDLNGLTGADHLWLVHQRAAPVQGTYLGYPNITAIRGMDARLVDSITDPPAESPRFGEPLVRIDPCFLCYAPPDDAPPLPVRPAPDPARPITFGSFNVLRKVNDATLNLWCRVLAAVPGSRLLLRSVTLRDKATARALADRIASRGVDRSRIDIRTAAMKMAEAMAMYGSMDIALDPIPYCGTTTTCEALFMGVPVVTCCPPGALHAGRVGASLLSAAGLPDLVARDADQFVAIAQRLAADRGTVAHLHATLRSRLLASALCDQAAMARRFQQVMLDLRGRQTAPAAGT